MCYYIFNKGLLYFHKAIFNDIIKKIVSSLWEDKGHLCIGLALFQIYFQHNDAGRSRFRPLPEVYDQGEK